MIQKRLKSTCKRDVPVDIHKVSLTEIASNDFRQINDKIDKIYDELISKLPISFRRSAKKTSVNLIFYRTLITTMRRLLRNIYSDNNKKTKTKKDHNTHTSVNSPLDVTDILSNSILAQELVNGQTDGKNVTDGGFTSSQTNMSQHSNSRNEFHFYNLSKNTTHEMILDYMKLKGINDLSHTKLTCLVSSKRDLSTLSYLSYKIDTDDATAAIIQDKHFEQKQSKRSSTADFCTKQATNFLSHHHHKDLNRRPN